MWKWGVGGQAKGVMVIVHGSGEHHGRYQWLRDHWNKDGFHIVQGDLPGQGANPKKKGHIDRFDEYIETITSWVKEAENYNLPIFILGHSLGGLAVIRTLQEKKLPITAIVLSSPCLGLVNYPPKFVVGIAKIIDRVKPDFRFQIKKSPVNHNATRNEDVLNADRNDPHIINSVSARWYLELEKAIGIAFDKINQFPNHPLLILQGGEDKIVDKYAVKKWFESLKISDREYKEWDGLYHEVFNEPERNEVYAHAKQFILQCLHKE